MILQANQFAVTRIDRNLRNLSRWEFHLHMAAIFIEKIVTVTVMSIYAYEHIGHKFYYIIISLVAVYLLIHIYFIVHAWTCSSIPKKTVRDLVTESRRLSDDILEILDFDVLPAGYNINDCNCWNLTIGNGLSRLLVNILNSYKYGTISTVENEVDRIEKMVKNDKEVAMEQLADEITKREKLLDKIKENKGYIILKNEFVNLNRVKAGSQYDMDARNGTT